MNAMTSQITVVSIVCLTICSGAHQRKYQKLRVTGLCEGNPPVIGGFPSQRVRNAKNVSIWWCHHAKSIAKTCLSIPNRWIFLKFCTGHGIPTVVLCAKFPKNSLTKMDVTDKRDFLVFQLKTGFGCYRPQVTSEPNHGKLTLLVSVSDNTGKQWEIHWLYTTQFISSLIEWSLGGHVVYAPSQWETTLLCDVVSHWLGACTSITLIPEQNGWYIAHISNTFSWKKTKTI